MERANLRLASSAPARPAVLDSRAAAATVGIVFLCGAAAATALGADEARRAPPAPEVAEEIVSQALESGSDSPQVRDALRSLRLSLGARPLDGRTRVLYASVLLELAGRADDTLAAAFHARRAVALAPVTVPVVRAAAFVLAQCGETDDAVDLTRAMFVYDALSASELLGMLEAFLTPEQATRALQDDPGAWLAWSRFLAGSGRDLESVAWLEQGRARWPEDLPIRRELAARAVARADWDALAKLLPPDEVLPREPQAAPLLAYRARLRAQQGDTSGARADARQAEEIGGAGLATLVGDALQAVGDFDAARSYWTRALYRLPRGDETRTTRISLLARLARLEEHRGRLGEAVRTWKAVLQIDPDHEEARRRVAAIGVKP